ncbi:hypothetical protein SKAU_G00354420 [Synaphobranchus kaupii]|uniref:Uncharacterized protein n=1 Tax=Synaphobranchus kaupii TaxID=118154 RepID=A0A9Q1IGG4_SYNKA|nr:hypothetical protein SKAU_G00354420 [Synaphobranchus kaupii]
MAPITAGGCRFATLAHKISSVLRRHTQIYRPQESNVSTGVSAAPPSSPDCSSDGGTGLNINPPVCPSLVRWGEDRSRARSRGSAYAVPLIRVANESGARHASPYTTEACPHHPSRTAKNLTGAGPAPRHEGRRPAKPAQEGATPPPDPSQHPTALSQPQLIGDHVT